MEIDRDDLAAIFEIVNGLDFVELSIEIPGLRIHVAREGAGTEPAAAEPAAAEPVAAEPAATEPAGVAADDPTEVTVDAPMLGTFYRAPKPGDPPYCEVGDKVAAGDVVGLVEVMKLMNPVLAPVDGVVTRILATNAQLVEYGQPLLALQPTAVGGEAA